MPKSRMPSSHSFQTKRSINNSVFCIALIAVSLFASTLSSAREKDGLQYGAGLIVNVPFPESEVTQAVQDTVQSGIIRGTKEYNKDEYISGANPATSSKAFPEWTEGGKVFYKVHRNTLDPRNFKDAGDVGTVTVRYIVMPQGDKNTVLRIDAIFVEEFRKASHLSNGSVETAEYKDIHDHLEALEVMKEQTVEAEKEKQAHLLKKTAPPSMTVNADMPKEASFETAPNQPSSEPISAIGASSASQSVQERVQQLRKQVERLVKEPGAPLKSAPFHTASTLQSLSPGTEVLVVISTPYWYGVETHDGQHGWVPRDQLDQLP